MKFQEVLREYFGYAPLPLAIERSWEIVLMSRNPIIGPVLDLGCGEGLFAKFLPGTPFEFGLDPDRKELDRARKYGVYHETLNTAGSSIPLKTGSISTVFSNSTLEHIHNLGPVVEEIYRVLESDGRVLLTLPTDKFDRYTLVSLILEKIGSRKLAKRYRDCFNWFWAHYNYKTPQEWESFFASYGFQTTQVFGYGKKWQCVLNELMAPFSIFSYMNKKLFNRWTISPKLKGIFLSPLRKIFEKLSLDFEEDLDKSGLVYFELIKAK